MSTQDAISAKSEHASLIAGNTTGQHDSHAVPDQTAQVLAAIIDSSDDAIISMNLGGIIMTWNRGAERIFGYKVEEVIGSQVTILGAAAPARRRHRHRHHPIDRLAAAHGARVLCGPSFVSS